MPRQASSMAPPSPPRPPSQDSGDFFLPRLRPRRPLRPRPRLCLPEPEPAPVSVSASVSAAATAAADAAASATGCRCRGPPRSPPQDIRGRRRLRRRVHEGSGAPFALRCCRYTPCPPAKRSAACLRAYVHSCRRRRLQKQPHPPGIAPRLPLCRLRPGASARSSCHRLFTSSLAAADRPALKGANRRSAT